jgi:signal transduction histidine kinase
LTIDVTRRSLPGWRAAGGELRGAALADRDAVRAAWLEEGGDAASVEVAERALGRLVAELDAERRRVEDELRVASELRERLLGIVSHDLRSPLSAITASAELLLRDARSTPHAERSALRIARSARRMERLLAATLDFTRARSGGALSIERAPADLVAIARQVIDEQRLASQGRALSFDARGDGRGAWDEGRVGQVVSNLVANALAHGRAGGEVRVSVDATGDPVVVEVHNDGAIPASARASLFEPFRRGGASSTGGLGLGLYITREIVRAHGGSIDVLSSEEEGTRFVVRLPRAIAIAT